jgi:multidrug efflux system membrane fusion protein
VPREAVNNGPNGQYVYVVSPEMVTQEQPVRVLFDDGTHSAVSGKLQPGDRVVTNGQLRVLPGGKVSISGARGAGQTEGRAGRGRGEE